MRHFSATMAAKNTLWMCVALAAGIVAAFLVVVLATPAKRAEAAFPGNNGKIAFVSDLNCCGKDWEIVTIKANGENQTNLTNNDRVDDFGPAFSPNGKMIAFQSIRSGNGDIFTMSADGTHQKRVTTGERHDFDPSWSPDGTKIVFSRRHHNGNTDIFVINKDGTGLTRLTTSPLDDFNPAWSPDGTRIAFVRGLDFEKIFVMKAAPESETNIPKRLTTSERGVEGDPAWSPDGTWIAYSRMRARVSDIYAIRPDGSGQILLTNSISSGRDVDPAWSPDGTKIAFSRSNAISVMKAAPESETNIPKRLTGASTFHIAADWQPLP